MGKVAVSQRWGEQNIVLVKLPRCGRAIAGYQITPEQSMGVGLFIVDPRNTLSLVAYGSATVYEATAGIIGLRQVLRYVHCGNAELRRIDPIVDERRPQIDRPCSALYRSKGRPVACQHGWRWKKGLDVCWIRSLRRFLIAGKVEQLVLYDRAADRSAELVPLQRTALRGEIFPGVKEIVASKIKSAAVQLVGA